MEYILNLLNSNNVELLASIEYRKINAKNSNGMSVLMNCCINEYNTIKDLLVYLLNRLNVEDIVYINNKNTSSLSLALKNSYPKSEEIVKLLLPYYDKTYIRSLYVSTTVKNNKLAIYDYLDLDKENAKYLEIISHIDKFSYKKLKLYTKEDLLCRNIANDNTILMYACEKTNKKSYKAVKYILKILNRNILDPNILDPNILDDGYLEQTLITKYFKSTILFKKYCNIEKHIDKYKIYELKKAIFKNNNAAIEFIIKRDYKIMDDDKYDIIEHAILLNSLIAIKLLLNSFEYNMSKILQIFLNNTLGSNTIELDIFYHIVKDIDIVSYSLLYCTFDSRSVYSVQYFETLLLKCKYSILNEYLHEIVDNICTNSHIQILNILLKYLEYEDIVKADTGGYTPFMKYYINCKRLTLTTESIFLHILKPKDIECTNNVNESIIDILHRYYTWDEYSIEKYTRLMQDIIPYYSTEYLRNRLLELDPITYCEDDLEYNIIDEYVNCCLK